MSGTRQRVPPPLACPFELQSAVINQILVGELYAAQSPLLSCGLISICSLKPSAAQALTSQTCSLGPFSRHIAEVFLRKSRICEGMRKGTRADRRGEFDCANSPTIQRVGGLVLRTAPRRGRDLAKRDEAQGGPREVRLWTHNPTYLLEI